MGCGLKGYFLLYRLPFIPGLVLGSILLLGVSCQVRRELDLSDRELPGGNMIAASRIAGSSVAHQDFGFVQDGTSASANEVAGAY